MESNLGEAAALPTLVDALDTLVGQLILEAQQVRADSNAPGTRWSDHRVLMTQYDIKCGVAYRLTRLIDEHRKGKLV